MRNTQCHYLNFFLPKLRRFLPFTVCLILLQTISLGIHAQGNWLWANYWTGNDDPLSSTNAYNYVVKTAFDDEGNIYAFGSCGGTAKIKDQSQTIHMLNNATVLTANTQGSVLAKYDRNGNLLWHRLIKSSGIGHDCHAYDMFLKDNKILIAGDYSFEYLEQLWFFDTLITTQCAMSHPGHSHPPYSYGNYSYFVTFDLNGNRLESHFVYTLTRESYTSAGIRFDLPLYMGFYGSNPLSIDSQGNCYLAMSFQYSGQDTLPFTIIIDADPQKTYDVFLPGNCDEGNFINNIMLYKFTSNWELDWAKLLIDHTEGLSPYLPRDTINPNFVPCVGGMSIDEEDNLYISGYLFDMEIMDEYNTYPMHIYWDSTHYATVIDKGMAKSMPFITRYNSDGEVLWSNQIYVSHPPTNTWQNYTIWRDNIIDNNSIYMIGHAIISEGVPSLIYFDEESNSMPVTQISEYFVRFNAQTGSFENYGIVPGNKTTMGIHGGVRPSVINNHLIMLAISYNSDFPFLLCYFNTNGVFDRADTITHPYDNMKNPDKTIVDNEGYILCDMICSQNLTFGNDFTLDLLGDTHSHAIIALKYDPSILEPYPVGVEQHIGKDKRLKLYPNPATDILNIESEGMEMEQICFVDINGKEIMKEEVHNRRSSVNVSSLPAGMYLVKILSDGEWSVGKFIKTKY